MTKVLERPVTELRTQTEVLPRPAEPRAKEPLPPAPRRYVRRVLWLLAVAVVAAVGTLAILDTVSDEQLAAPSIYYETLREPYEIESSAAWMNQPYAASVAAWNEFLELQAAVDTSPPYAASVAAWNEFLAMQQAVADTPAPYAASVAAWNEFLAMQQAAVDTSPPYAASVAAWNEFLAMQAAAEAIEQLPYASSIAAWNEFLEFGS